MPKLYTQKEIDFLRKNYSQIGRRECARILNRPVSSIRYKTSQLGLKQDRNSKFFKEWQSRAKKTKIGKKRPVHSKIMKEKAKNGELELQFTTGRKMSEHERLACVERAKNYIKNHGHPRGMKGKKHAAETLKVISRKSKEMWEDPNNFLNSEKHRQNLSDRMSKNMAERIQNKGTIYSRSHNGWYEINNQKYFFRSMWEVNYARYLQFLKSKKQIKSWKYEEDTFWFENIKRGVRSYKPDFKVENLDGNIEYHEVKGYMDDRSKTKIKRMGKYYPETKLILIQKEEYKSIMQMERLYPEATLTSNPNNV